MVRKAEGVREDQTTTSSRADFKENNLLKGKSQQPRPEWDKHLGISAKIKKQKAELKESSQTVAACPTGALEGQKEFSQHHNSLCLFWACSAELRGHPTAGSCPSGGHNLPGTSPWKKGSGWSSSEAKLDPDNLFDPWPRIKPSAGGFHRGNSALLPGAEAAQGQLLDRKTPCPRRPCCQKPPSRAPRLQHQSTSC